MPRRLRPDPAVAARRADVERLTKEGLCSTDIANELNIPVHLVWADTHWNKANGRAERARKTVLGADAAAYLRASRTPLGTLGEMLAMFDLDVAAWLIKDAPKGVSVAELVAAIVKDAYADEKEKP